MIPEPIERRLPWWGGQARGLSLPSEVGCRATHASPFRATEKGTTVKICIHRGTREIGGTCVEVEAQEKRIAIDGGLPLDAPDGEPHEYLLPPDAGHQAPAFRTATHSPTRISSPTTRPFGSGRFALRPISSTIAPSTRMRYSSRPTASASSTSGDFRGHGRKAVLFERTIERPPPNIDVLLMEGATIGRTGTSEGFPYQGRPGKGIRPSVQGNQTLRLDSSQNIDRLVTIFRAGKGAGRVLVVDLYTVVALKAIGRDRIPQSDWSLVRLYTPQSQ